MSSNSKFKVFQRNAARRSMLCSVWLFERLPYMVMKQVAKVFIFIAFQLTRRHRRVAYESLGIAFGDQKSDEEKKEIVKKCFSGFGMGMIELFYFMAKTNELKKKVNLIGREHFDEALKKGKGVIAVTAHFGNFPLMMLYFAEEGYDVNCIMRRTRDPDLDKYLLRKREAAGLKSIYTKPRIRCVNDSIKVLRDNALLFIPIDQNFGGGGGVFVDFFGRKAATATGPAVLARRTEAVVVPTFIIRKDHDNHDIIIEKPIEIEEKETEEETLTYNMAKITALVEKYIREYPYEWAWMHRRWKTQSDSNEE